MEWGKKLCEEMIVIRWNGVKDENRFVLSMISFINKLRQETVIRWNGVKDVSHIFSGK